MSKTGKISFISFCISFVAWAFSSLEKANNLGWISDNYSKWIVPVSGTLSAILFLMTSWDFVKRVFEKIEEIKASVNDNISKGNDEVNKNISMGYAAVLNIISSIKGVDIQHKETDVARKLLKMQLGDIAEVILPTTASFPITLVPGGDIALIMDQKKYSEIVSGLISDIKSKYQDCKIYWTTFVPFESLNKNLSGYSNDQWANRLEKNQMNFSPSNNGNFFEYLSQWNSVKGQQIIILDIMQESKSPLLHPLNYQKYSDGKIFNLDLIKYLYVRYALYDDINKFIRLEENYFLDVNVKNNVINADRNHDNVKWISLAEAQKIVREIQNKHRQNIYNIDFIYFDKPGNDFALVRVDADNNFSSDGGIVGVTFVVFVSYSLTLYSEIFNEMWNRAKQTFKELTEETL